MWFEKFWVEVLHLRHHTCGSWGSGPFAQVRCPPGLLARCGWSASFCCRHVDNSTAVHSDRRSSTSTPLVAPCSSPCHVHGGRPLDLVVRERIDSFRRKARSVTCAPVFRSSPSCRDIRRAGIADRHRDGSPQPVHIPGDNFSTCRPDRRSMTSLCRVGTGVPLSTELHTTVDSDMSTRSRRQPECDVGGAQPDAPDDLDRVLQQPPPPSTARVATTPRGSRRAGPQGPRGEPEAGSEQSGNGSWPRCGPEDRGHHCRARLLMRAVSSVTWV